MAKLMLIGRSGCGKTTLSQAIHRLPQEETKTQTIEYYPQVVDTPGEYIEKRFYYHALLISAADCQLIAFVQDCQDESCIFPPGFAALLGKKTIGIITKTDQGTDSIGHVRKMLESAGVEQVFEVSAKNGTGIEEIRALLVE
ncbi:EutP/PduV family microcompartment system protein [Geosporobacter ferrireducens]|uniref:Ethanolamine utilization protein EutP n=1 Tax=Geosporobacter ferrireducens TaxID=1424294 RepID=A0A1D8GJ18_9FIRM|nr:EutP/PduV family microcompartment system protein [Geosporobacter ferrireducens]AOT70900.1 ethanolamine utilization protein EutP [Geosporobacter ferrireducens]MTI53605.1 EutP/PduV family microcompartment system protein [Geosporobacter ferrireducens]